MAVKKLDLMSLRGFFDVVRSDDDRPTVNSAQTE